ncbi:hypothetical protein OYC64_000997 [Pagothenia borchgrevinki]|uniref:Uncharacterized protein n=1 Tax=Pagothenia borchgrevinki TaxID=8213 RepID=A0ABD2HEC6_PAGBO
MGGAGSKKREDLWPPDPGPSMLSRKDVWQRLRRHEPEPNFFSSFLTMPFTMSGAEKIFWSLKCEIEPLKWAEEEREDASAKRPEIRTMQ